MIVNPVSGKRLHNTETSTKFAQNLGGTARLRLRLALKIYPEPYNGEVQR